MSMQVTWLEQTRSCMLLTSEDPESSGPLRIVTEELARVKSRQQDIVSIAKKKQHTNSNLYLHVHNDVHVSTKIGTYSGFQDHSATGLLQQGV